MNESEQFTTNLISRITDQFVAKMLVLKSVSISDHDKYRSALVDAFSAYAKAYGLAGGLADLDKLLQPGSRIRSVEPIVEGTRLAGLEINKALARRS